jgi:hypothetical protein
MGQNIAERAQAANPDWPVCAQFGRIAPR